jgi:hypothetical protein
MEESIDYARAEFLAKDISNTRISGNREVRPSFDAQEKCLNSEQRSARLLESPTHFSLSPLGLCVGRNATAVECAIPTGSWQIAP